MSWSRIAWLALAVDLASLVNAQASGWQQNQVNATMCTWKAPRVATIRDTVYIDGGYLWWYPGLADGTYGAPTADNNPLGLIYTLNFSRSFNTSQNITEIMGKISKAPNGNAANNLAPNYYDGAMMANDAELFLYGGLLTKTDSFSSPDAHNIISYQIYQYGPEKGAWSPGFLNNELPDDMTSYLTYGATASSPSENKAWYFGGYRSKTWGPIYYPSANDSVNPLNVSNTLITLDMATQQQEKWTNATLPENVKGRANPDLVWIPVGEQGILVALGGVVYPDYNNAEFKSQNEAASKEQSPTFMSTIDIYDIASDKWYRQPTVGGPTQLAMGCAVMSPALDYSSYNIYYYGGYDGLNESHDFNDDVWILSLPSFIWMKLASGKASHARAGHKCVQPYPDQMMVIGGYNSGKGGGFDCVEDGIVQIFNLTGGAWLDSYDPTVWADYGVPAKIHLMIGGSYSGGATMTTPSPSGWAEPELASVFQKTYPISRLTTWYPYPSDLGNATRSNVGSGPPSLVPSWIAPFLGVFLGLVFVTAIVVAIMLYRRRKLLKRGGMSEGGTDENGYRILSWIRGQDANKAPTVTTEDTSGNSDDMDSRVGGPIQPQQQQQPQMTSVQHHEMPDTPLVELMDTSPRVELGDTGLTPIDVINKHSHFARPPHSTGTPTNPSSFSQSNYAVSQDQYSISAASGLRGPPSMEPRPDSPALGNPGAETPPTPPPAAARIVSGVSGISERDQAHLRQMSDGSISSSMGIVPSAPTSPVSVSAVPFSAGGVGPVTPPLSVSPPTGDVREAPDYISVYGRGVTGQSGQPITPSRRNVFYESAADLG